ncbi:hypothetical protein D9M69_404270 [compost metagenome]
MKWHDDITALANPEATGLRPKIGKNCFLQLMAIAPFKLRPYDKTIIHMLGGIG